MTEVETSPARQALTLLAVVVLVASAGCTGLGQRVSGDDAAAEIQFENATAASGLDYSDTVERGGAGNGNAGVYAVDYDRDGYTDLLTLGGERPALFRNGGGEFERSGQLSGLNRSYKSAAVVDYDGDGWQDVLLLARNGSAVALHNDEGSLERTDVGLGAFTNPLGAATADYDGDGDQDLFVYQSGRWTEGTPAGRFAGQGFVAEDNGNPNYLYENTEEGFQRVEDAGIGGERWSLAASFVDLTGDGRPDVHVANDYNSDILYVNQGDGEFEQRVIGGHTARNGMASEVVDVDGDGRLDVFTTNIELPITRDSVGRERYRRIEQILTFVIHSDRTLGNTLLVNRGNGTFIDRADAYGVQVGGWGWEASFADFDNDGRRDLIHTTQEVVRIDPDDPTFTYPMLWRNNGSGFTSLDADARGLDEHNGRGMATLDYDRDGDQDVVVATYDGPVVVYENTVPRRTNSIEFRVIAAGGNGTAVGATVTVEAGDRSTSVVQHSRTGYLSRDSPVSHLGTGSADEVTLRVSWPDGTTRTFDGVAVNQRVRVTNSGVETVSRFDGDE